MIVKTIVVIMLICINGIFAATEAAYLSINKIKLLKDINLKNKKALKVKKLLENPSGFLATIQIAITLAGLLASAVAAEGFVEILIDSLAFLNVSKKILKTVLIIVVTIILSYFTLVFGELIPKRIGMNYPKLVAYKMVNIVTFLMKVTYPFVYILTKSTNFFTKKINKEKEEKEKMTLEELKLVIERGKKIGIVEDKEAEYIFNIFEFNDKKISEIITKKENIIGINIDSTSSEILKCIQENRYTRYPIFDEKNKNIVGILNVKDIIELYVTKQKFDLKNIMRKPKYVKEDSIIDDVFREMQNEKENMVVVIGSKSEILGIATLEDILEEIVGNIFDEYDAD